MACQWAWLSLKPSETAALITICQVYGKRCPWATEAVGFLLKEGGMDTGRLESVWLLCMQEMRRVGQALL
ncbi:MULTISPECIES: hypothetical protein [unclassified Bartonella]|uniref:hypothetical protein n=1 Tax=unclassified Bartonella TaxID=2645622 RepID=UPI0035CF0711